MADYTSEELFTRAFGGLFLPERPSLSNLAKHELEHQLGRHRLFGQHPQPRWSLAARSPFVHRRPNGGSVNPDLLLFEDGNPAIRAVIEMKLGASPQVPSLASCRALPPAPGAAAGQIRKAYEDGRATLTGKLEPGVWQIDAYRGWAWWTGQTIFEQPMTLADDAVFILLSRDGMEPDEMYKDDAVSAREWIPLSFRKIIASLFDHQRRVLLGNEERLVLDPDLNLVETDAIAALAFLAFTDDYATEAKDHEEWVERINGRKPRMRGPKPGPLPQREIDRRNASTPRLDS